MEGSPLGAGSVVNGQMTIDKANYRRVHPPSAWSVKTRRAPSRHCRDAIVYGLTATAMHENESTPPPRPPPVFAENLRCPVVSSLGRLLLPRGPCASLLLKTRERTCALRRKKSRRKYLQFCFVQEGPPLLDKHLIVTGSP